MRSRLGMWSSDPLEQPPADGPYDYRRQSEANIALLQTLLVGTADGDDGHP